MNGIFLSDKTVAYVIAVVAVIVAFLLSGGKNWMAVQFMAMGRWAV